MEELGITEHLKAHTLDTPCTCICRHERWRGEYTAHVYTYFCEHCGKFAVSLIEASYFIALDDAIDDLLA